MKEFFKNHFAIIIVSFFVSVLFIYPTIYTVYKIGFENFKGVYPILTDDEEYYIALTKEVEDGHPGLGSPFTWEHKNEPYTMAPLMQIIMANIAKLLHISIQQLFIICDFLLPFIGIIILYFLFFDISKSRNISIFSSALFYFIFLREFNRPINPQLIFIFLFIGVFCIRRIYYETINNVNILKNSIILSFCFILLLYSSFYFWSGLIVLYFVSLFFKGLLDKNRLFLKSIYYFAITSFLFILPYAYNSFRALGSKGYADAVERFGMIYTHFPGCYYNAIMVIFTISLVLIIRKKITRKSLFFIFTLLISALGLLWQNVITGKYLQLSTHYSMTIVFFIFIVFVELFTNLNHKDYKKEQRITVIALVMLFLYFIIFINGYAIRGALIVPKQVIDQTREMQKNKVIIDWLNSETAKDSVIYYLGSDFFQSIIVAYTHNNLYDYPYTLVYAIPDDEMEDRWVRQNIFQSVDQNYIINNNVNIWLGKFLNVYQNNIVKNKVRNIFNNKKEAHLEIVPPNFVERVLRKYNEVKKENIEYSLKKYRIDYIMLNTKEENSNQIAQKLTELNFIKPVKEFNNYKIYKVE